MITNTHYTTGYIKAITKTLALILLALAVIYVTFAVLSAAFMPPDNETDAINAAVMSSDITFGFNVAN